jgi:putative aldouronate transport system permease protein
MEKQSPGGETKKRKRWIKAGNLQLTVMCVPVLLLIALFNYLPMFGLVIAFKNYRFDKGIFGSDWVGLANFEFLFRSGQIINVIKNTLIMNFSLIILGTVVSVVLALLLYELTHKFIIKTYQTIIFIPFFLSWVVVTYISYAFFNESFGILNKIIASFGLQTISWYAESNLWPFILVIVGTWKGLGFGTIIYYSALMSIDNEYFEAASIDGASRLRMMWNISLPFLTPLITILTLLGVGRIFYSDFGLFYFLPMQSGLLQDTTQVIDTYIFRSLRVVGDIGMSSAANFFQSVIGLILILASNYIVSRKNPDNALF